MTTIVTRTGSYEPRCDGIDSSCCSVKSGSVSLGTFTWSPFVMTSDPAPGTARFFWDVPG